MKRGRKEGRTVKRTALAVTGKTASPIGEREGPSTIQTLLGRNLDKSIVPKMCSSSCTGNGTEMSISASVHFSPGNGRHLEIFSRQPGAMQAPGRIQNTAAGKRLLLHPNFNELLGLVNSFISYQVGKYCPTELPQMRSWLWDYSLLI